MTTDNLNKLWGQLHNKDMVIRKAKYIRREGGPGNYKYIYKEGEGPSSGSHEHEKKESHDSGNHDHKTEEEHDQHERAVRAEYKHENEKLINLETAKDRPFNSDRKSQDEFNEKIKAQKEIVMALNSKLYSIGKENQRRAGVKPFKNRSTPKEDKQMRDRIRPFKHS